MTGTELRPEVTEADVQRVRSMVSGYRLSKAIYAAVELGVAEVLAAGPVDGERLAARCGAHPVVLDQLLRVLTDAGLLAHRDGTFLLTELGRLLESDHPAGMRAWIRSTCAEEYLAWDAVLHTVRTGTAGFDRVFGVGFWEYLRDHPDAGARFAAGMSGLVRRCGEFVLAGFDFSTAGVVVDVGGGDGTMLTMLLAAHPGLSGIVFDLPEVAQAAWARLREAGLADRGTAVGGSFLGEVPGGGDVYLLCRVLGDWDDPTAARILTSCRRAMRQGTTMLVAGALLREDDAHAADVHDLHMRVVVGGRQRTAAEIRTLLRDTGFRVDRVVHSADRQAGLVVATAD